MDVQNEAETQYISGGGRPDRRVSKVPAFFAIAKTKPVQDAFIKTFGCDFHVVNITQLFIDESFANNEEGSWNIRIRHPLFCAALKAEGKPVLWYWNIGDPSVLGFKEMKYKRTAIRFSIDTFFEAHGGRHGILYASREARSIIDIKASGVYNWAKEDFERRVECVYTEDELYVEEKLRPLTPQQLFPAAAHEI